MSNLLQYWQYQVKAPFISKWQQFSQKGNYNMLPYSVGTSKLFANVGRSLNCSHNGRRVLLNWETFTFISNANIRCYQFIMHKPAMSWINPTQSPVVRPIRFHTLSWIQIRPMQNCCVINCMQGTSPHVWVEFLILYSLFGVSLQTWVCVIISSLSHP